MNMVKYNIVVLGGGGVGKSAITLSFTRNQFVEEYDPTIEDCYCKTCKIDDIECNLDITDTAGQEEYRGLFGDKFMRQGDGFICVYSITARESLEELGPIRDQIHRAKEYGPCPIIILGNKSDLHQFRQVTTGEGQAFARQSNALFLETSAKERVNIDEAFHSLVQEIRRQSNISAANGHNGTGHNSTQQQSPSEPKAPSSGCCIIL